MHQPPATGIEAIPAMHDAAVVPHDEIVRLPFLHPLNGCVASSMIPQRIQHFLAFVDRQADKVGPRPTTQIKRLAARLGMRPDDRVNRARDFRNVVDFDTLQSLAQRA